MDELVQLEEELNLSSEDELPELDDLVHKLHSIRQNGAKIGKNLLFQIIYKLSCITPYSRRGIYNRAVLIIGERSPFTQGFESELKSLSELQPEIYENTALDSG